MFNLLLLHLFVHESFAQSYVPQLEAVPFRPILIQSVTHADAELPTGLSSEKKLRALSEQLLQELHVPVVSKKSKADFILTATVQAIECYPKADVMVCDSVVEWLLWDADANSSSPMEKFVMQATMTNGDDIANAEDMDIAVMAGLVDLLALPQFQALVVSK